MSFDKLNGRFGMFSLNGQTALVTGASRGIGLSVAQTLAGLGATVVLNSQDGDALDLLIQEGRAAGFNFHSKVFDAGVPEQAIFAVDEITAEIGSIDIIFCNAGIQHRDDLLDFSLSDFQRVIDFNLTAQWALARHVATGMVHRRHGRIIFTGSITAILGRQKVTAYTAAKGALHALVRQWSSELAQFGVTINAIAPGYIQTELTKALWQDPAFDRWLLERTPAGRWGQPKDIAAAAAFLASLEAGFVTGQVLAVDGGLSASM